MIDYLKFYFFKVSLKTFFVFCKTGFAVIGVELTLREFFSLHPALGNIVEAFLKALSESNLEWGFYILLAVIVGFWTSRPKREVSAVIFGTDVRISCECI